MDCVDVKADACSSPLQSVCHLDRLGNSDGIGKRLACVTVLHLLT